MADKKIKPTEGELEILSILWDKENATVRDVHECINLVKESGYTTTLKLMQIMFEKGLAGRDESNRKHIYFPLVSKAGTQEQLVDKMVQTLFNGNRTALVMQALGQHQPSADEIDAIQQLLNELKK